MSLPHVILTLLDKKSSTGYDITKTFASDVGYYWTASHQQVYRELNKLCNDKKVNVAVVPQDGKPDKKVYSITKNGRIELQIWLNTPDKQPIVRDQFCAKLMACESYPEDKYLENLKELMKETEKKLEYFEDELERMHILSLPIDRKGMLKFLSIKKNIVTYSAWVAWATEVIKYIDKENK